jgi:hypothetical protein
MTCGWPGSVSEIQWSFVARSGDKDVYRFTRRFPVEGSFNGPDTKVTTKEVEFAGPRIIVFQDASQVIVIESPGSSPM